MTTAERIGPQALLSLPAVLEGSAALAARLRRSVVAIGSGRGSGHGSGRGVGAGTVWRPELIVTNHHVVGGKQARVETADGRTIEARVTARDREHDLVALEAPGLDLDPLATREAASLRLGELLFAVGHPWAEAGSVSAGIVLTTGPASAEHRVPVADTVRADLRLAPGNSGGPLADARGRVVGINSMIAGGSAVAIPSEAVERMLAGGERRPGFLGIVGRAVPLAEDGGADAGLLITEVVVGSAAEGARLLPGDILVGLDGERGLETIAQRLRGIVVDVPLRLLLLRGGSPLEVEVRPGEAPAAWSSSA